MTAPLPVALGGPSLENASLDSLYREWAGFAEATYQFSPEFDLGVGGRWSENKQSASEVTTGASAHVRGPAFPAGRFRRLDRHMTSPTRLRHAGT